MDAHANPLALQVYVVTSETKEAVQEVIDTVTGKNRKY